MKHSKQIRSALILLLVLVMVFSTAACKKNGDNLTSSGEPIAASGDQADGTGSDSSKSDKTDKKNSSKTSGSSSKKNTSSKKTSGSNSSGTKSGSASANKSNTTGGNQSGSTDSGEQPRVITLHKYETWTSASATSHSSKCTDCGKVEKQDHVWNDGVVAVAPTASAKGTFKYTCQICGYTKTEPISYEELKGNAYSTGHKVATAYSASNSRKFKVYGVSYSDDYYCAAYGECANGLAVLAQTEDGCYAVDSTDGCFALRMRSKNEETKIQYSLWYNGKRIGSPVTLDTQVITSDYDTNDDWKAMVGYDNQGFFSKMLPFYTGEKQLSSATSASVQQKFSRRVNELKQIGNGCQIICVLAPSSVTTYPELVPEKYNKRNVTDYYSQVASCLSGAGVTVVNLRSAFAKHKNDAIPLFNKYDSHWTDYGAYIAYVEMYNQIAKKFPAAAPRKFSEFNWVRNYFYGSDIPSYLSIDTKPATKLFEYGVRRDMASNAPSVIKNIKRFKVNNSVCYDVYGDDIMEERTYDTSRSNLPSVCVIRNSFGTQIYDLIAERSNKSHFSAIFSYGWDNSLLNSMKPDYLIYVFSEWELEKILNN